MHSDYLNFCFSELRDCLIDSGGRALMIDVANRSEALFYEVDAAQTYSCRSLCQRLTTFEPQDCSDNHVSGEAAQHDLRRLVEDLTDAADLRADEVGEAVHTVDELSKMWNVSSKTINRWRAAGLIGRRLLFEGRKRLGFLRTSALRFAQDNPTRIRRGGEFRHLTEAERREVLDAVKQLSSRGRSRSQVYAVVAERMNCSVETVRTTVKRHEVESPESPLFATSDSPLSESMQVKIYAGFRRGASIETLAGRFRRSSSTIRRIVNQRRYEAAMALPLDYIANEEFDAAGAESTILAPMTVAPSGRKARPPKDLPAYLSSLYDVPLLNREQEAHLFRKMNYLKYRASLLRDQLEADRPSGKLLDQIEEFYGQAVETKNLIVRSNLRLVVSIVRKRITPVQELFELISEGNVSLMRAVDKFDYGRGFKFSTYASWAIIKNLARTVPMEFKQASRYRTSQDELLDATSDYRSNRLDLEDEQRKRENQVSSILSELNDRERTIIVRRFGLERAREPQTLKELGVELGVTKERVRQLQLRAMNKLRTAARKANILLPD